MQLLVIGSGSKGNCYILKGKYETLILEAGVNFSEVKQALDFDLSSVIGCLITHEHGDHSKYVSDVLKAGIDVFTSKGTAIRIQKSHTRLITSCTADKAFLLGAFIIRPFKVIHDAAEPYGFLINHPEVGNMIFVTDTHFIANRFPGLNNIICEVNYSLEIANQNIENGAPKAVRDRVLTTHMELSTFKEFLQSNDMTRVNNIVMVHLSDGNSNAKFFQQEIEDLVPGKTVHIAEKGMIINFDKTPF